MIAGVVIFIICVAAIIYYQRFHGKKDLTSNQVVESKSSITSNQVVETSDKCDVNVEQVAPSVQNAKSDFYSSAVLSTSET